MSDGGYSETESSVAKGAKPTDVPVARKRLQQAIEATNQNRIFQLDDLRFAAASPDNKFQWPEAIVRLREADPNGARPVLTLNKLPQHILQVTNEQRQNRPSIKVSPVDDKGDKEVAEILTGVIRHIEYISDADVAYATAGDNQVTHGEGYVRVLTDYVDERSNEQEIMIGTVKNSFSVYMDPIGLMKDPTGRYCEWAFIVQDLPRDEYDREYPDADPINWDLVGNGDEWKAWFPDSDTVRIAEYFCYVYEKTTLSQWPDGSYTVKGEPAPMDPLTSAPYAKAIKTRETQLRKVMWQKMNGQEVIEDKDWAGSLLPIVRMAGNEWWVDGKMIVAGIVRNAKDAQRMFNYWKSTECETLALAPKSPFVGPAEAFEGYENDWQTANQKNFAFLKYNQFTEDGKLIERPERQTPPMPPIGIVNAALGAADDIKSTTGQYDPSLGNNPQAKSGIALQREQRKTDMGTYHYIDNQARGVKQLGRVLVDLVPKIYDTKRVARILGEDGETDHAILDPDAQQPVQEQPNAETGEIEKIYNPCIGRYDVTVSVGPGYASKRQEAADFMAQVLQGNKELMAIMGDLYFKMLDVPGADAISERLKKALPPGLAEPEDGEEPQPMVPTPQGPMPIDAAAQLIAHLMQQGEQMNEQLQKADVAKKMKDAADAEHRVKSIDLERDQLDAQHAKDVADDDRSKRELEIKAYEAETARILAESTAEKNKSDLGDLENRAREELERTMGEAQDAIEKAQTSALDSNSIREAVAPLHEALAKHAELLMKPRRAYGPDGSLIATTEEPNGGMVQ